MVRRKGIPPGQKAMVAVESEAFKKAEAEAAERKKRKPKSVRANVPEQTGERPRDAVAALFEVSPRSVSDAKALKERVQDLAARD